MTDNLNIMIVGVGGQGTLLASRILGAAVIKAGMDVKVSEVHGMSQRGGSVVTYVRSGKQVASPIITEGQADLILSFEQLEAARWLKFLKIGGKIITNTQSINPVPVIMGVAEYPERIIEKISEKGVEVISLDALPLAVESGSEKAVNVVLIGAMAKNTDIPYEIWEEAVKETVPEKFLDINLKAFKAGYNIK